MCHQVDCGCEQHFRHSAHRGWHHHQNYCCSAGYLQRRFPSKEEVTEELEEYLKQLKDEAKGVEEQITELREKS